MTQLYQISRILVTYADKNHTKAYVIKIDRDKNDVNTRHPLKRFKYSRHGFEVFLTLIYVQFI